MRQNTGNPERYHSAFITRKQFRTEKRGGGMMKINSKLQSATGRPQHGLWIRLGKVTESHGHGRNGADVSVFDDTQLGSRPPWTAIRPEDFFFS